MVQYSPTGFDASFAALSDATRRGVLEQAGLATTSRFDELDEVVEELKPKEKVNGRKKRK